MTRWPWVDEDWIAVQSSAVRCALVALAALLVLGAGAAVRLPDLLRLQQEQALVSQALAAEEQAGRRDVAGLQALRAKLIGVQSEVQGALWRLSAGEGVAGLVEHLSRSAQVRGVILERLELLDEIREDLYWRMPMQVQVVGRYGALRHLLDDWLGQVRVLGTGDFQWRQTESEDGLLRLTLQVNAYRAEGEPVMPASLADEPARPLPAAPAGDLFASGGGPGEAGLAGVALGQLRMVGSLARGGERQALLLAGGQVYRVQLGDVLGRNEGRVANIDETTLEVRERLFANGSWHEHSVYLSVGHRRHGEGRDEVGQKLEMAVGADDADPAGFGDSLPW